jgi:molybdopterin synthase sulfur carrier subunit
MPSVTVHVPAALQELTGGRSRIPIDATSVDGVLAALRECEPLLSARLFGDGGELRGHVNLFLNGSDIRRLESDRRTIRSDVELYIVPSVAGG